jgi:hypothetical protein
MSYIPARIGLELPALRWMFGGVVENKLDPLVEQSLAAVVNDLEAFRRARFAGPSETEARTAENGCPEYGERIICLGRWEELMPGDGTHLEIVQGASSGQDAISGRESAELARRAAAESTRIEQEAALAGKVTANVSAPTDVHVHVVTGSGASDTRLG